ncbi:putative glycerophosphocholine phosphodiesterase GPCPD1 homolog 2 isoform X2 [Oscarella lobularis]|uniref:putative glycerophosphocholine phosphodiesterase GPCPD1 homolog 2 isoform X2 n=1 Tax=Oscarella lobularis TaxID=121494 RepID=UPI003313F2C0
MVLLPGETEVRIRVHDAFEYPVCLWETTGYEDRVRIRLTTESKNRLLDPETSKYRCLKVYEVDGSLTTISQLQDSGLAYDGPWRMLCFVFRSQSSLLPLMLYRISVYLKTDDKDVYEIGETWISPSQMSGSQGILKLLLLSEKSRPVGFIVVDYLIVKSFESDKSPPATNWWQSLNSSAPSLHIGHRGVGMSLNRSCGASCAENTLPSLELAGKSGADFVEFDVSLSKDKELVLFHDCHVQIKQGRLTVTQDLKNMTASELKLMTKSTNTELEDSKYFPTLTETLEKIEKDVGFLIEAKFPEPEEDVPLPATYYFDRNEYAEILLKALFQSARSRRIILTSFDADFCTMLKLKQSVYPVLFTTCLDDSSCQRCSFDLRSKTLNFSVAFAEAENFLGISALQKTFLNNPSLIKVPQSRGKLLFVWSDRETTRDEVQLFEEKGVNGIIYDRIDVIRGASAH